MVHELRSPRLSLFIAAEGIDLVRVGRTCVEILHVDRAVGVETLAAAQADLLPGTSLEAEAVLSGEVAAKIDHAQGVTAALDGLHLDCRPLLDHTQRFVHAAAQGAMSAHAAVGALEMWREDADVVPGREVDGRVVEFRNDEASVVVLAAPPVAAQRGACLPAPVGVGDDAFAGTVGIFEQQFGHESCGAVVLYLAFGETSVEVVDVVDAASHLCNEGVAALGQEVSHVVGGEEQRLLIFAFAGFEHGIGDGLSVQSQSEHTECAGIDAGTRHFLVEGEGAAKVRHTRFLLCHLSKGFVVGPSVGGCQDGEGCREVGGDVVALAHGMVVLARIKYDAVDAPDAAQVERHDHRHSHVLLGGPTKGAAVNDAVGQVRQCPAVLWQFPCVSIFADRERGRTGHIVRAAIHLHFSELDKRETRIGRGTQTEFRHVQPHVATRDRRVEDNAHPVERLQADVGMNPPSRPLRGIHEGCLERRSRRGAAVGRLDRHRPRVGGTTLQRRAFVLDAVGHRAFHPARVPDFAASSVAHRNLVGRLLHVALVALQLPTEPRRRRVNAERTAQALHFQIVDLGCCPGCKGGNHHAEQHHEISF